MIHLILPKARIIDCVSASKQLFAEGQEFSYDLADPGRYYRGYVELMDHWVTALPAGRILADLEGQVRRPNHRKHDEPWLTPLKTALGPALER
jgi:hypothetical protein